eukprot:7661868-Lingulodinium_polyedra.AAC.1
MSQRRWERVAPDRDAATDGSAYGGGNPETVGAEEPPGQKAENAGGQWMALPRVWSDNMSQQRQQLGASSTSWRREQW